MTPWLSVIGIGADGLPGLSPAANGLLAAAELVVGGARHLELAAPLTEEFGIETRVWDSPIGDGIDSLAAERGRRVAVLASGDPMHYGVGTLLARRFGAEVTVVPAVGAVSLACARLGWPVAETRPVTLHGRPLDGLRLHLAPGARLVLFSADRKTPPAVAALLADAGYGASPMTVLENLGSDAERHLAATAETWDQACADLNVIGLECRAGPDARPLSRLAGLPDDAFAHDGQITKREVRAATLAALGPLPGERLWDVGAGSGSVAIEWLRAPGRTTALAIERSPARRDLAARNAAQLGVPGLELVAGEAPAALAGLATPDAVFLGGGLTAPGLVEACWSALRPGGRLVANAVTAEGELVLLAERAARGGDLARLAVSRLEPVGPRHGWRPLMPVTQWRAVKP